MRDVCNSIKRGVATLGTLVAMTLSTGVKAEAPVCYIPPDYSPNIVEVDKPEVNQDLSKRTVIEDIPEDIMFQSLEELAAVAEAEEAHAYNPESERLLEVGVCELSGGVVPDYEMIKKLSKDSKTIYAIHIHPTRRYMFEQAQGNENYVQSMRMLNDVITSYGDIKSMMILSQEIDNVRYFAVSEYGVLEYGLTDYGKEYFSLVDMSAINDYAQEYHEAVLEVFKNLQSSSEEFSGCENKQAIDIVKELAEALSDDYVTIKFTVNEEL